MDARTLARALQRGWYLVLVFALVGTAAGGAVALTRDRMYQSTATAFVATGSAASVSDLSQGNAFVQQAVKSYADVATTAYILDKVISQLKLDDSVAQLSSRINVDSPLETTIIRITVSDSSPTRAADISNAVTRQLSTSVHSLTPGSSVDAAVKITQLQQAEPAATPSSTSPLTLVLIGFIIGAFAGVLVLLARDRLNNHVGSSAELEALAASPALGFTPYRADAANRPLAMLTAEPDASTEAFRSLRTALQFLNFDEAPKAIVVTSARAGEGKSSTVANLGIALADAGERVLLVDADLRRPTLASLFGVDTSIGLVDVLIGSVALTDALQQSSAGSLSILPSGPTPPNPSELLQSENMRMLVNQLRGDWDIVLFDSPPLLPVSDAAILTKRTDGAIYIAAADLPTRQQVRAALSTLTHIHARVLGVVLTRVRVPAYNYNRMY